jgi:hypothetical protein
MAVGNEIDNDGLLLRYPQPFLEVILSRAEHTSFSRCLRGSQARASPKPTQEAAP